jgi:Glycosyltransferase 61
MPFDMINFLQTAEIKFLRRLFLKNRSLIKYYLGFRNVLVSKKIILSSLQSAKSLKGTKHFNEVFKEVHFKFNFENVHSSLNSDEIRVPANGYYTLDNILVNSSSHLFYFRGSWYHQEVPAVDCARWAAAGKHLIESTTSHILTYELETEVVEKGIFIGGHFSKNWYHWVMEIVSRIALLKQADFDFKGYHLCLPGINENLKNYMDLIDFLDLDVNIKYLDERKYYRIKDAVVADAAFFGRPHWKRKKECNSQLPYFASHEALKGYQQLFLRKLGIVHSEDGKRIFLGRKNQRRLYNQDEVYGFFEKHGFEMIYCEDLTVKQQIELFSHVDIVVGPTGASWTNLLYCKPGCKAFCWAPDFKEAYPVFAILGLALGVDIRYDFFKVEGDDWRTWKANGNYNLTVEFLERNFKLLMENN